MAAKVPFLAMSYYIGHFERFIFFTYWMIARFLHYLADLFPVNIKLIL